LHLTPTEIEQASALESCAFRFIGTFNDVYSWEKEWKTYQENKTDGAHPFSAIFILAKETGLSYSACKRMMLVYCRELELAFKQSEEDISQNSPPLRPDMIKYMRGLEYLMSGVESWTKWTPRYRT
jgi:aristolochene synthase